MSVTGSARPVNIGLVLNVWEWPGERECFVLLHGLASNARTWSAVAQRLASGGHRVIAYDQRGHGLSQKPASGYDFAAFAEDLARVIEALGLVRPIVVGQSWGGNVVLEFAVRHPGLARGLGFIDGGFLDMHSRPGATWESVRSELRPPALEGISREQMRAWIRAEHPDWPEQGVDNTLANLEVLPDGTVRRWLSLEAHLAILKAMWEQRPARLYPRVREPVLICAAEPGESLLNKRREVAAAQAGLARCEVEWFAMTDHDIHVHRAQALAARFEQALAGGIWAKESP